jgi:hypothetical protein
MPDTPPRPPAVLPFAPAPPPLVTASDPRDRPADAQANGRPVRQRAMRGRPGLVDAGRPAHPVTQEISLVAVEPANDDFDPAELDADIAALEPERSEPWPADGQLTTAPVRPAIRMDPDLAAPRSRASFYASVVADCAERLATLAMHRVIRPFSLAQSREDRILEQLDAILAAADPMKNVLAWWNAAGGAEHPHHLWPVVLTAGAIPSPEPLEDLTELVLTLPPDAHRSVGVLGEALSAVAHPHAQALADAWRKSEHPVARAAGLDLLARRGLLEPDDLLARASSSGAEIAAALRALVGLPAFVGPESAVNLLDHADAEVVWQAARATTLWGYPDALARIRSGRGLPSLRPALVAEILVMVGLPDDLAGLEIRLREEPPTAALLSALGRFGSPGVWSFLCHLLGDKELADDAASALEVLFGERVHPALRRDGVAWKVAISDAGFDPDARYRCGEPWTPARVVAECTSGRLPRSEIERRVDELRARTGAELGVDCSAWAPDFERAGGFSALVQARLPWRAGDFTR